MRLPLSVLDSEPEKFIKCMEERGFVVLTDLGSGEEVNARNIPFPAFGARPRDLNAMSSRFTRRRWRSSVPCAPRTPRARRARPAKKCTATRGGAYPRPGPRQQALHAGENRSLRGRSIP